MKSNNVGRHFCPDFQGVYPDFQRFCPNFQGFCPNFKQIKTVVGALAPPAPPPPTPLLCHIIGPYTSSYRSHFASVHQKLLDWSLQRFFCAVKKNSKKIPLLVTVLLSVVTYLTTKAIWSLWDTSEVLSLMTTKYLASRTSWRVTVFTFFDKQNKLILNRD